MIDKIKEDIITLEDGFKYFWPERVLGAMSSSQLRKIADYLDEQNKELEENIEKYFEAQKTNEQLEKANTI